MTTPSMEIATLRDVMTLGEVLAKSGFFQDARGAAQAVVKVLAGRELGFGPIASMTGVHIVKGKPVMAANLIAAAVKRSGKYDYKVRELSKTVCKLEFFEGKVSAGESTFTIEDAKTAGLGGANWEHFTKNMLFARAMSNGVKFYCPDVTSGPVYTPDELGIDVDGETGEVKNLTTVTVEETPASPPVEPGDDVLFFDAAQEQLQERLVAECGAIIKDALTKKTITQQDVRKMKATYLQDENADPSKCDVALLSDLRAYLKTRFER